MSGVYGDPCVSDLSVLESCDGKCWSNLGKLAKCGASRLSVAKVWIRQQSSGKQLVCLERNWRFLWHMKGDNYSHARFVGFSCLIGWHRLCFCSLEKSCRPYYPNCGKRTLLSSSFKLIHVFSHAPPLIIKGEQNPNAPSICMCDQQLSLQRLYCSAVVNSGQIYVHIYIFYFFVVFLFFF